MALRNNKWKSGDTDDNHFDMIADQLNPFDVADSYDARAGDDTVFGNFVDNRIKLGSGDDWANGRLGSDEMYGGLDDDTMYGDGGGDQMYGEGGRDLLRGGNDGDRLFGGAQNDTLYGDSGVDKLDGGTGSDKLYGGSHGDELTDGSSDATFDILSGEAGSDTLTSRGGGDQMSGGSGNDVFHFGNAAAFAAAGGTISGGGDTDTLMFGRATDVDSFSFASSIEKFDLRDGNSQTLRLNFDEVRDLSGTDKILVFGESVDRIVLDDTVTGDALNGGRWSVGAPSNPNSDGTHLKTYSYLDAAGDHTGIEITIHSPIDVDLI